MLSASWIWQLKGWLFVLQTRLMPAVIQTKSSVLTFLLFNYVPFNNKTEDEEFD